MPETVESLQYELTANLAPLFAALEQGLKGVKDRINAFKDGKVDLSVDTKGLANALNKATDQVNVWRKDGEAAAKSVGNAMTDLGSKTKSAAQVGETGIGTMVKGLVGMYLSVETLRRGIEFLKTGIVEAAQEQREISGLAAQFGDMGLNVGEAQAQVEAFTTSMKGAGFEDDQTRAAIMRMLPVTGNLTQAMSAVRVAIGWNIKYNKDFNETLDLMTGLIAGSARALMPKTLAEYGIQVDKTRSQTEQFQQVLNEITHKVDDVAASTSDAKAKVLELGIALGDFKKGAGSAFLPAIQDMGAALHAVGLNFQSLGEGAMTAALRTARAWKVMTAGLDGLNDALKLYNTYRGAMAFGAPAPDSAPPQTNARQAAIDEQVVAANALVAKLKSQAEVDAANKAEAAWKKAMAEGQRAAEDFWKKLVATADKAKTTWAEMSHAMAGDMLKASDPTEFERSQIRLQALREQDAAKAALTGQALADALVRIEQWKAEMIGQINDKQRQEEFAKAKEASDKARDAAEKALQEANTLFHQKVQNILDPMGAMVKKAYATMSVAAATWAERVSQMMQPLSQAIQSFLMGMKVSWGNVLRQMAVTFLMQFVNRFLAWVAGMVVTWITGETVKTAASETGAAAQAVAAKEVAKSNASVAASAMSAAVASIWEAYAGIPYAGIGLAIAGTAAAMFSWGAATAAAIGVSASTLVLAAGGLVERPTFALVGEAGPELVAPAQDFKAVVGSLLASTVATVQLAAIGAGPAGGGGGAMGASTWEPHFHGFAFVDSGNRGYMRAAARKMASAMAAESRQRLAR